MHGLVNRTIVLSVIGLALAACGASSSTGRTSSGSTPGVPANPVQGSGTAADHRAAAAFESIPAAYVQAAFCAENGKWLYDFEDVESWDPAGAYYPGTDDSCPWCSSWCQSHTCQATVECAHSHCFNCYLKGKAFWWLLARMAGWSA